MSALRVTAVSDVPSPDTAGDEALVAADRPSAGPRRPGTRSSALRLAPRSQIVRNCHIGGMKHWEQCPDVELLLAARTCPEPFGVFYERHFASVLAFFRRRVPGPEEAFDLAAETFAAALGSVPRFRPGPEPAQAWLFAIARHKLSEALRSNHIQDEARRALAMHPIRLDDEAIEILETIASAPAIELLDALPARQREAIEAHHLDERGYAEIAAELHCSASVVRKRVSRGLAALRSSFGRSGPDE